MNLCRKLECYSVIWYFTNQEHCVSPRSKDQHEQTLKTKPTQVILQHASLSKVTSAPHRTSTAAQVKIYNILKNYLRFRKRHAAFQRQMKMPLTVVQLAEGILQRNSRA